MKHILFLPVFVFVLFAGSVRAERNKDLMKADYLYSHLAYHEAIPYYERVAGGSADPLVLARLGDCYRLTKAPQEAAAWYAKAVTIPACPAVVKLHYGQMLMMLGRYDEAADWLGQYHAAVPDERRAANLIEGCRQAKQLPQHASDGSLSFLGFNTDRSEFGPSLRKGQLVFTADTVLSATGGKTDEWTGMPFYNILTVPCGQDGLCTGEIKRVAANINTKFHDGPAVFSADGSTMYFTRTNFTEKFLSRGAVPDQDGIVRLQILTATGYDEAAGRFEKITSFPFNSKQYSTAHPTVSPGGNILVFASDMPGGSGGTDLYLCIKEGAGWSAPRNIGTTINTEGDEMFPFLYDDRTLYFASDGHPGLGGLDIYRAVWNDRENGFGKPEHMGAPVNSSYDDMSLVLTAGGSGGYFASNRPAPRKGDNIYFVNLEKIYLSLKVTDAETSQPIYGAAVSLQGMGDRRTFTSDAAGHVMAQLQPQGRYVIGATRAGYKPGSLEVTATGIRKQDTLYREIRLAPDFSIGYQVVVLDRATRRPIERPMLVWARLGGAGPDTVMLGTGEAYSITLDKDARYHVYAVKDRYYSNEKIVSTVGISRSAGTTMLYDTLFMKELKTGEVYEIENIYYDYDKATIREDAKPALNRLLELLRQYPAMQIQINSHTDCRGSDAYNLRLSQARAQSVIRYLQERGIGKDRLLHKGFGERMPVERCTSCERCTEQQHQRNRRTEFQVIAM